MSREPLERSQEPPIPQDSVLAIAFDLSPVGMAILDERLGFRLVNEAYCRLTGYPSHELLGLYLPDITHPEDHWLDQEWFDYVFDKEMDSFSREKRLVHRDGETIWVTMNSRKASTEIEAPTLTVNTIEPMMGGEAEAAAEAARLEWSTRIENALANDDLVLHGQPIIDLKSGEVVQHELLIRMEREATQRPLIMPREFMPPAEKFGLVDQIDMWVTRRALLIARSRRVTINLSGSTISRPDLIETIERTVQSSGVDPQNLMFEITETAVIENLAAASDFVNRLHQLGCRFALDDFGTGYGSFAYLKRLDVDCLKIDLEFVRDMVNNEADRKVIKSIVATAELFDIETIAEGVEDADTLELLRSYGIDYAQGFHIGRPSEIGG